VDKLAEEMAYYVLEAAFLGTHAQRLRGLAKVEVIYHLVIPDQFYPCVKCGEELFRNAGRIR